MPAVTSVNNEERWIGGRRASDELGKVGTDLGRSGSRAEGLRLPDKGKVAPRSGEVI